MIVKFKDWSPWILQYRGFTGQGHYCNWQLVSVFTQTIFFCDGRQQSACCFLVICELGSVHFSSMCAVNIRFFSWYWKKAMEVFSFSLKTCITSF